MLGALVVGLWVAHAKPSPEGKPNYFCRVSHPIFKDVQVFFFLMSPMRESSPNETSKFSMKFIRNVCSVAFLSRICETANDEEFSLVLLISKPHGYKKRK